MNLQQAKSLVRSFGQTFGPLIAVYLAARGVLPADQVMAIFNSDVLMGLAASALFALWGYVTHSQPNAVAVVDAMPEVAGVVTKSTVAGKSLAESVPSQPVAVAGTPDAKSIASK